MTTPTLMAPTPVTTDHLDLLKRTLAKDATPDELKLYLYDCARQGVHPLDKLIHFTKRSGKYTPVTSIDFMRIRAADTGEYAGSDDARFAGDLQQFALFAATVTVYRLVQGQRCAFTATARWTEYKPDQDFMWKRMPHTMLAKCAEALALRKGFPKQLAGLYATEELDQANIPAPSSVATPPLGVVAQTLSRHVGGVHLTQEAAVEAWPMRRMVPPRPVTDKPPAPKPTPPTTPTPPPSEPAPSPVPRDEPAGPSSVATPPLGVVAQTPASAPLPGELPPEAVLITRIEVGTGKARGTVITHQGEEVRVYDDHLLKQAADLCETGIPVRLLLQVPKTGGTPYLKGLMPVAPMGPVTAEVEPPPAPDEELPF